MRKLAMLAKKKKKSITVTISFRSITVVGLGLCTACSQAMSSDPRMFICDSWEEGQKDRVTLIPESQQVDVRGTLYNNDTGAYRPNEENDRGVYRYNEELLSQEKRQQGWRRWITNESALGLPNSWSELNIKTGEYRYIGINGQVESRGQCSQEK